MIKVLDIKTYVIMKVKFKKGVKYMLKNKNIVSVLIVTLILISSVVGVYASEVTGIVFHFAEKYDFIPTFEEGYVVTEEDLVVMETDSMTWQLLSGYTIYPNRPLKVSDTYVEVNYNGIISREKINVVGKKVVNQDELETMSGEVIDNIQTLSSVENVQILGGERVSQQENKFNNQQTFFQRILIMFSSFLSGMNKIIIS